MKPTLKRTNQELTGKHPWLSGDCSRLRGDCSGLHGNCSALIGDCSGLIGDCSWLSGNFDDCEIGKDGRTKGWVDILSLISQ
jgi:hypothetical protein